MYEVFRYKQGVACLHATPLRNVNSIIKLIEDLQYLMRRFFHYSASMHPD